MTWLCAILGASCWSSEDLETDVPVLFVTAVSLSQEKEPKDANLELNKLVRLFLRGNGMLSGSGSFLRKLCFMGDNVSPQQKSGEIDGVAVNKKTNTSFVLTV